MTTTERKLTLNHPHVKIASGWLEWEQPRPDLEHLGAVELLTRMAHELTGNVRIARFPDGLRLLAEVRYDGWEHDLEGQLQRLGQALTGGSVSTGHGDSRSDVDVDLLSSVLAELPGPWTERDDAWVMPLPGTASGELVVEPVAGCVQCRALLLASEPSLEGDVLLATAGYLLAAHRSLRLCRAQLDAAGVHVVSTAALDDLSTNLADSREAVVTAVRLLAGSLRALQIPAASKHYIRHMKLS